MSKHSKHFDFAIMVSILVLLVFGIVMITSIGVPKSIQLSAPSLAFPNCDLEGVDCYLLLKNHLLRLAVGLIAFLIALKLNYRFWKKISLPFFLICVIALFAVLIFGAKNNTFAKSWFNIYSNSVQPSEYAKLGLILYFSTWLEKKGDEIKSFKFGFIPFCVVSGLIILPVMLQPDLGSTIVFAATSVAIYFASGARKRDLVFGALVAIFISTILISNIPHLKNRFGAFIAHGQECKEKYCWQSIQSNIAVGSGGAWGRGLTQGIQKSYWLPQATDDFIFAASAEELGFFGVTLWIILYTLIVYRGLQISQYAPNRFAMLTAVGVSIWFGTQAFLNIAVNISLMPVTGLTLPLISYGGSSLVSMLLGLGILLNISKHTHAYANSLKRRGDRRSYLPKYSYSRRSI